MIRNFRDHSANERTFLAWVRTVTSIEGFGIAAARIAGGTPPVWSEIILLASGAIVVLLAFLRMRRLARRLESATDADDDSAGADLLMLLLVTALFGLIAAFLLHLS